MDEVKSAEGTVTRNLADDIDALKNRITELESALDTFGDAINNRLDLLEKASQSGGDPDLMARLKYIADKYFHDDHPS